MVRNPPDKNADVQGKIHQGEAQLDSVHVSMSELPMEVIEGNAECYSEEEEQIYGHEKYGTFKNNAMYGGHA